MARRTFYVIDITEILIHWYAGRSQHELAASLQLDRKTIRRYLAPAARVKIFEAGVSGIH
jgi:DNA-binding transcriptional regulator LsrR (DeoR family)